MLQLVLVSPRPDKVDVQAFTMKKRNALSHTHKGKGRLMNVCEKWGCHSAAIKTLAGNVTWCQQMKKGVCVWGKMLCGSFFHPSSLIYFLKWYCSLLAHSPKSYCHSFLYSLAFLFRSHSDSFGLPITHIKRKGETL